MHATWEGAEEYYDERDDRLEGDTLDAIKALLPKFLQQAIFDDWEGSAPPPPKKWTLEEFKNLLEEYVADHKTQRTLKTQSGIWRLYINEGVWYWLSTPTSNKNSRDTQIEVQATPFFEGRMEIPFDSHDIENIDSPDPWGITFGADFLTKPHFTPETYLNPEVTDRWLDKDYKIKTFLNHIYRPLVRQVLNGKEVQEAVGNEYTTWDTESWVSSYAFKYPPKQGTMTQKFTDYLKENPRRTANQFYEDVLGRSRPRGHNNMFFASIKDSGIVKMERQGRQFVYSLGPNYDTWTQGKLLRTGGRNY